MKTWAIEAVNDTRAWDWSIGKAIPGSGSPQACEHCGTQHEVHVTIFNRSENKRLVVGSTCAKKLCFNGEKVNSYNLKANARWAKYQAARERWAA